MQVTFGVPGGTAMGQCSSPPTSGDHCAAAQPHSPVGWFGLLWVALGCFGWLWGALGLPAREWISNFEGTLLGSFAGNFASSFLCSFARPEQTQHDE